MTEIIAPPKTVAIDHTVSGFVQAELAKGSTPNRLIDEKSPYLLQHAFNPVNWLPWGEEAFARAKKEEKPIFLSIGYSTCHWCHVMARESFEDPATAALLNEHFVCIKVDREERPDVDQLYMAAAQSLTGGGGWPLSVFLTPDRLPFYAGTYFPPSSRHGLPGFGELLQGIASAWQGDRPHIMEVAGKVRERLQKRARVSLGAGELSQEVLAKGFRQFAAEYDDSFGGFGREPKFPRPVSFNFLLRYFRRTQDEKALAMVATTLRKMAAGGICDQLGGGFHRYSVDRQWRVPHFEKMLYDQAQLAGSYLEAYQLTHEPRLAATAQAILDYVLRDMTGPHGAFYSAEDADSPLPENPAVHMEGAFYLWTAAEIEQLLGSKDAAVFNHRFGVIAKGNALADPQGEFAGKNILYQASSVEETAQHFGRPLEEIETLLASTGRRLFAERSKRPRPHLDDKVITAWNGLMISALAKGFQVFGEEHYLKAARGAASFILTELYEAAGGVLHRRYREGVAGLPAHLDDYAFLVQGLLDLYEASFDVWWLEKAVKLAEKQIDLFADEKGGFFDTSGQDGTVLVRMKADYDGAEPTGNSVAAVNFLRLARMTGREEWEKRAESAIAAFGDTLRESPLVMPQMTAALGFQLAVPSQIVIAGWPGSNDTRQLLAEVHHRFLPHTALLLADGGKGQQWLGRRLPFVAETTMLDGRATAHVCKNFSCRLPTNDLQQFREQLDELERGDG
ncbi:MAG: thioredoxin domain-containing protein [Deltaproteobacteria bacterium]|jgi:uncharacterized protein YyaL (SSP411 family)